MSWGIGDRVGVAVGIGNISSFLSKSIQSRGPQPSLILDFAGTGTLDSRITFTRSTTGTYYNSSGVLTSAAINAARFDYNPSTLAPLGLLIEQSSTNLILYSQDYTQSAWNKTNSTITANNTTAPDGTTTGDKITLNAVGNTSYIAQAITYVSGTVYTISVYVKAGNTSKFQLQTNAWGTLSFDISTQTYAAISGTILAAGVTTVNNGWYRCYVTFTATSGGSQNTYVRGDAVALIGDNFYLWGVQPEALAFPTSYIPTTTAQVTRAADNASMTGTNFSSWYNATQGTIYSEAASAFVSASSGIYAITSTIGTITNNSIFSKFWSDQKLRVFNSGTSVVNLGAVLETANTFSKIANVYSSGSYLSSRNGATPFSSSYAFVPSGLIALNIGAGAASEQLNGWIKKFTYYPTRLTNAQLQALTT
jgi:hypothetical protein